MKAIRTNNDIRRYGDVTVKGLIEHSPVWGYKEGDTGKQLQFGQYALDFTEQEIRDRLNDIIKYNSSYSIDILNTYEDSILYIDRNHGNLYGIASVSGSTNLWASGSTNVWVIQPSAISFKHAKQTNNIGLIDEWGTNIIWIIDNIKAVKDVSDMNPKRITVQYIDLL